MTREQILNEAIRCVTKDRNTTHGEPEDNFKHIAWLWNAWLSMRGAGDLTSQDVAIMNALQKIARLVSTPERYDHWVDIAGYAACGGGIATKDDTVDQINKVFKNPLV